MSQINVGTVNASVGVQLQPYTSVTRPAASTGLMIYNSDLGTPEIHTGSDWVTVGGQQDPSLIGSGTTAERPSADREKTIRWNTDNQVLETFISHNSSNNNEAWHAVGGRQLISRCIRNDGWSSVDILWGGAAGRNTKYYAYEIVISLYEPSDASDRNYYCRFIKGDGNVDTASTYFWSGYWQQANDGVARLNSGTGGTDYVPLSVPNNNSYNLISNGESTYGATLWLTNTPNNSTTNYWAWNVTAAGSAEQGGGFLYCGGAWRNPTQVGGNAYPMNGIRVYTNGAQRSVSQGVNLVVTTYGYAGHEGQELGYPTVG